MEESFDLKEHIEAALAGIRLDSDVGPPAAPATDTLLPLRRRVAALRTALQQRPGLAWLDLVESALLEERQHQARLQSLNARLRQLVNARTA